MCNYRKDNTTVFKTDECLPQNVDWFGFDFYQDDSTSWTVRLAAWSNAMPHHMSVLLPMHDRQHRPSSRTTVYLRSQAVEEANSNSVFPRLSRPDQRVVPTSLGYAEGNFTKDEVAAWDSICTTNGGCTLRPVSVCLSVCVDSWYQNQKLKKRSVKLSCISSCVWRCSHSIFEVRA